MIPLLKLLAGNLGEAYALGMIECKKSDIADFLTSAVASWNVAADQNKEYERVMRGTRKRFHRLFRPIQAFRGRTIPFCNVIRLGAFARYWLDALDPAAGGPDAGLAKDRVTALAALTAPASPGDIAELRDCFVRLNDWIKHSGSSKSGVAMNIGALLDPANRPFWVGGRVNRPELSAQYWRDRLGLIHVSAGGRCCPDLLVRIRFVAGMASEDLPRDRHLEYRSLQQHALWLFRPSTLHEGNRRFVQGVAADRRGRPARRGSTRDLSTTHYREGERELLLLAGELASVRLVGLDLFDGFADTNPARDSDDDAFVQSIAQQRGWPP